MHGVISKRYWVAIRAFLVVIAAVALKLTAHWLGWEFISLNPLFSGIVAANVFLMSFLLSGVLTDYKESERLPGELASSLEAIADEAFVIYPSKKAPAAEECLRDSLGLGESMIRWFYKKERTEALMERLSGFSFRLAALEPLTQATFIVRLKQEQGNIRRIVTRIHAIRETSFVALGYMLADATTVCLIAGLILVKIDPFHEAVFFIGVITFLLVFLGLLIRDLDNPFGHYEQTSAEDVSLKPLNDAVKRIRSRCSDGTAATACGLIELAACHGPQHPPTNPALIGVGKIG